MGCKGRLARKADNLTAVCEPIIWNIWEPRRLSTLSASTACYGENFLRGPREGLFSTGRT
jgi:hypothetical protein